MTWLCTRRAWIAEPLKVSRRLAVDELPLPRPTPPRRNTRDTHARGNRDLAPAPHARHAEPRQRRAALSAHAAWPPLDTAAAGRRRRRRRWRRRCTGRRGANSRLLRRVHVERGEPRLRPVRRRRAEPPLPTRSATPPSFPALFTRSRRPTHKHERRDDETDGATGTTTTTTTTTTARAPRPIPLFCASSDAPRRT